MIENLGELTKDAAGIFKHASILTKPYQTQIDTMRKNSIDPVDDNYLGKCLDEAKSIITGKRQDSYGNPEDSFQIISEYWTTFLRHRFGDKEILLNSLDIANMMILFKQARKLGQIHSRDNYLDSCGYESIAADRLSDNK
jgi:hypothetical protein